MIAELLPQLFNVISPVFFIALIGYVWVKRGYEFPSDFVTRVNMNIGTPCLVFVGLIGLGDKLLQSTSFIGATLISIATMLSISTLFALVFKLPIRSYVIALYSTNSGNMGAPLCLFAFGQQGLSLALAYYSVSALIQFTAGLFISHGHLTAKSLTRITLFYGVFAALFFILADITVPTWLMNTTKLLASLAIPLMLLMLGASLARLTMENSGKIVVISAFKLALGIGVGFGVSTLFGFTGNERNVIIMQSSMPVAVFSYLLASQYNRNPNDVAGLVFITTLMSLVTVPLLLTYLM